jgi:hypothetical protein
MKSIDFAAVAPRHDALHYRLEQWGRWVTQMPKAWGTHPMFRQYRSHAWQWERPEIYVVGNPLDHAETERAVSALPPKHRHAIRWAYAFPWVPPSAVRRDLALTREALGQMLHDGRDMLANRLKQSNCGANG